MLVEKCSRDDSAVLSSSIDPCRRQASSNCNNESKNFGLSNPDLFVLWDSSRHAARQQPLLTSFERVGVFFSASLARTNVCIGTPFATFCMTSNTASRSCFCKVASCLLWHRDGGRLGDLGDARAVPFNFRAAFRRISSSSNETDGSRC